MRALVFGTTTQPWTPPEGANRLARNLAVTPVALRDLPDARPLRPDWFVTRPLLTGICGSDSKQILLDFEGDSDSAMSGLCSFPQVMGHEVVAEITELGPEAEGFDLGQRVVLNPWLSCAPRGIRPRCPACEAGDFSLCWSFTAGSISPGIHTGVSSDATGGYAELMPAHSSMLFVVPDAIDDEHAIFADPFAVSLHSITRHPPPPGGRALVWGAGALGSCAIAILRALYPDVEVAVVARFDAQARLAARLGAHRVVRLGTAPELVEELAAWSGGVLRPTMEGLDGLPMCHPGGIDVAYDTVAKPETLEVAVRVLKARGTLVQTGVHAPGRWEWSPLYFKEISWAGSNAFGIEEVEGVRKHGIEHYLDLALDGRIDLTGMLTHTFGLSEWQDAFYAIADQEHSGAIKVAIDPREVMTMATVHPLEPLTSEEITAAVVAVRGSGRITDAARFSTITLDEPPKGELGAVGRRVRLVIVPGPECSLIEATVALPAGEVVAWVEREGVRPALGFEESFNAILALHEHDGFKAALAARGITDLDRVQIDPWPTGSFGIAAEDGRRVARCICFYREEPGANGYARPIEGLQALVDMGRSEVLEVLDLGAAPLPVEPGSYYPEDNGPLRDDLRPLEIVQPEGVSFTLDGNLLRWQRWSLRVSLDPLEGLVLHTVGYEDGGRIRSILHRASISEMVVPYGDPGPVHGWKNAFDAGEWGLGRMANSLTLGCDCLGEIRYLDAVMADERGNPTTTTNAICIHEEDYGILWKHVDLLQGRAEVRRSRRLVVSSIATVGNYEYGFYWYFYLDGSLQLEVKLTGIMSTGAGEPTAHAPAIAPGLVAPVHQHLFCARLDFDVDGRVNEVHEVDVEPMAGGDDNPWSNGFTPVATRLERESQARRRVAPGRSRVWKVSNPTVRNGLGQPVAYKLTPGASPTLLASEGSSIAARAGFATQNLWVTPYAPDERRAAGDHPNQHAGGDGLPRWTAADRSLVDTDIVVWHTFGVTHVPRPEDWPVMPVEYCGFLLSPAGFFDHNPALDVPPPPSHCH